MKGAVRFELCDPPLMTPSDNPEPDADPEAAESAPAPPVPVAPEAAEPTTPLAPQPGYAPAPVGPERNRRLVWSFLAAAVTFFIGLALGLAIDDSDGEEAASGGEESATSGETDAAEEVNLLQEAKTACAFDIYEVRLADGNDTLTIEGAGLASSEATFEVLYCIFEAVGMPDSTITRVETTRALDGFQDVTFGEFAASWTYHPDDGLNMTITRPE